MNGFRFARPTDQARVRELWEQGFGDEGPAYTDWYFRRVWQPQRTLCLEVNGSIVSCLQLAPYLIRLNEEARRAAYIVGVVTDEAQRGHGYGGALMRQSLSQLKAADYQLAMLYTDIPDFYRPLGFVHCYQLRQWLLRSSAAPFLSGWRQAPADWQTIAHCSRVYQRMTQDWNGYLLRSPGNWRLFLEDPSNCGGGIWLGPDAYFLWVEEEGDFLLRELGFVDEQSLEQGLAQARTLAGQLGYARLRWLAPLSVPSAAVERQKLIPFAMCRRLDLDADFPAPEAAAFTRELFAETPNRNWVNEYV